MKNNIKVIFTVKTHEENKVLFLPYTSIFPVQIMEATEQ